MGLCPTSYAEIVSCLDKSSNFRIGAGEGRLCQSPRPVPALCVLLGTVPRLSAWTLFLTLSFAWHGLLSS